MPWASLVLRQKRICLQCETQVRSLGGKIPWRRAWQPTVEFLPGEFHWQRSLGLQSMGSQRVGYDWATNILFSSLYQQVVDDKETETSMYRMTTPSFIAICLKNSCYWLPNPPASLSLAGDGIEDGGHLRGLLFSWISSMYTNLYLLSDICFLPVPLSLITGTLSQKPGRIKRLFFPCVLLIKSLNILQRQQQTGQPRPVSFRLPLTCFLPGYALKCSSFSFQVTHSAPVYCPQSFPVTLDVT